MSVLLLFLKKYWKELALIAIILGLLTSNALKEAKVQTLKAEIVVYEMSLESLKNGIDFQNDAINGLRISSEKFRDSFNESRVEVDKQFEANQRYIENLKVNITVPKDCAGVNQWLIEKAGQI